MIKKKTFKGRLSFINNYHQPLWKGVYAGIANESARISETQLKAAEFAMKRVLRKNGEYIIRINPSIPVTQKAVKVRMGKGKGAINYSMARVRPGTIIFEIVCHTNSNQIIVDKKGEILARKAYRVAISKLPLQARFVKVPT